MTYTITSYEFGAYVRHNECFDHTTEVEAVLFVLEGDKPWLTMKVCLPATFVSVEDVADGQPFDLESVPSYALLDPECFQPN